MQELTTFIQNHALLAASSAAVFILLLLVELARANRKSICITPLQTTQMINHDHAIIIDLRNKDLFNKGHIINAEIMTAQEVEDSSKKMEKWKTRPIIIVCQQGIDSQKIAASLLKRGYNAYALAGGMRAWNDAQLPLVKE